jgi:hypothetical protein
MCRSALVAARCIECPATSIVPASGTNRPVSSWNSVDLPAPLGPSSATKLRGASASVTASSATRSP